MSIIRKSFSIVALFFALLLSAIVSPAQDLTATIRFVPPAALKIEGKLNDRKSDEKNRNWFFRQSIAGSENLGARISNFNLMDVENRSVAFKKLTDGEYLADAAAENFSYQINLESATDVVAMAHVSHIADEHGILMLDDLLPQIAVENCAISAEIKFDLPSGWKMHSGEKSVGENTFYAANVETAIFAVGKSWRVEKIPVGRTFFDLAISGEWQFSDAEAARAAREITAEYQKLFGALPTEKTCIFLARAPDAAGFGRWAAETRGANVTIVSAAMPFKNQALQLLQEQLRHEIFHLWMPNDLALTGNYDWFYEGFTVYQALRTGVALNQITFADFLDTLAQAYRLDDWQSERVSLIESSKNRWRGADNPIYARGMLTAFLCDVALLRASKGRRSISEILREIYQKHRSPTAPEDGSAAVLKVLRSHSELNSVVENYISGTQKINWKNDLASLGIEASGESSALRLKVKTKLGGVQKDLLNDLGYNNWRKLSGKRK